MKIINAFLGILKIFEGFALVYLAFLFLGWYIKMHFHKKWFLLFWLNTIICILTELNFQSELKREREYNKTGQEIWIENHAGR